MYEGVDLNHSEGNNTDAYLMVTVKPEGQSDIHRSALQNNHTDAVGLWPCSPYGSSQEKSLKNSVAGQTT